jgi:hypothetical protein
MNGDQVVDLSLHTQQNAFPRSTRELEALQQLTPEEKEKRWMELLRAPASDPDQVPFDLKSIVNATHATIKYRDEYGEDMYQFNIIPGGYFPGSPKTFTITNIPDEDEHMKHEKEAFLNEILGKPIVLTVDHMKPADIIISHHSSSSSSDKLDGVYVFELVTGAAASEAGGGGAAGGGGSQGGGKSVRRRSRKSYSRRRRVSNKKYSASRRGRGRGRGRGRRSRKN